MAEGEGELIPSSFDFSLIPEGCIAAIVAFTTPRDACRFALVSRDFLSASDSDAVWDQFLPPDCDLVVSRSDAGEAVLAEFRKKKQLFMHVADRPLLIDAASKSFWLEKSSGKKCWMIGARSLYIVWGDTPRYWKWTSIPESRFPEVAELVHVCWFDISVSIMRSTLSPGTQYAAYIVYKLTSSAYGFDGTIEASIHSTSGIVTTRRVHVTDQQGAQSRNRRMVAFAESSTECSPNRRSDGWMELKIGEFLTDPRLEEDDEVRLSVRETEVLNWKTGFIAQGIEVRPAQG